MKIRMLAAIASFVWTFSGPSLWASEKDYGPGVTDTEIRIGQTMPYSGPASAYGTVGKVEAAYFRRLNERGGINGRKINLISLDDGYSPPKTVEQTRKLIEGDEVLLDFNPLGTSTNASIQKYLNARKVPQLFVGSGIGKWADPERFPWTIGWQPTYGLEASVYARFIRETMPDAKIAILYQNDDLGKEYAEGLRQGLGAAAAKLIVMEQSFNVTDPTIDSQVVNLKASGATVFFNAATSRFAAQAIRRAYEIGWKPTQFLANVASSIGATLVPAGTEKAVGIISSEYRKDAMDPKWRDDPGVIEFTAFMKEYYPDGDLRDINNAYGYSIAQTLEHVLRSCGENLSRDNVMKQATDIRDLELPMLLSGIKINTSRAHFLPIDQLQLTRFDGKSWVLLDTESR
jgi:branched-chain amino acid transport system substrate-binding protein